MPRFLYNVLIVTGFWLFNQLLSVFNSWVFRVKKFRFPVAVTISQALFYWIIVLLGASCGSQRMKRALANGRLLLSSGDASRAPSKWQIWTVVIWSTLNICLNNASLMYISLSMNQIIRSCIPVVTALVASCHGTVPGLDETGALGTLTAGVAVVVADSSIHSVESNGFRDVELYGVVLCLLGTVAGAYMLHSTNAVMKASDWNAIDLGYCMAPITALLLFPLFFMYEGASLLEYVRHDPLNAFWVLCVSSTLASIYNLVHWQLCGNVGPTVTTVLGQVKIVSLIVISQVYLEEEYSAINGMKLGGMLLAFAGFCWYGMIKSAKKKCKIDKVKTI